MNLLYPLSPFFLFLSDKGSGLELNILVPQPPEITGTCPPLLGLWGLFVFY